MLRVREFAGVAAAAVVAVAIVTVVSERWLSRYEPEATVFNKSISRLVERVTPAVKVRATGVAIVLGAPPSVLELIAQGRDAILRKLHGVASARLAALLPTDRSGSRNVATQKVAGQVDLTLSPPPGLRPAEDEARAFRVPHSLANSVAFRVRQSVPPELAQYFYVYLYVSKAALGPWAQHMFIFHKDADDRLVFERAVPVSTGRERRERYFTATPAGLFELDPNRFDRSHYSHRWNNAPMPWAMFLNYTIHDCLTGIALHSGVGHVALLGRRGGCVRLPPKIAEMLFKRFQAHERGMVPRFAFSEGHSATLTDGTIERRAGGEPVMTRGYKVLLIIQNYSGAQALVAELS